VRAHGDLFPTDLGLLTRMALVGLATPLVVAAGLVGVVEWAPWEVVTVVFGALVVGGWVGVRERVAVSSRGCRLSVADAPELHAIVERLCVVGDIAKPAIVLDRQLQPNSWIEGTKRGGYRLHLTQGLLDILEPRELEAVIAHELAHVANRDAAVMTIVGGPGEALLSGGVRVAGQGWWPLVVGGVAATVIGWVGTLGTRALSRYREFAADEGAVRLTGSPAALACALMKVSEGIGAIPARDLRAAAVTDAFHLLPVSSEAQFALPATHPPLEARIARLERLEAALQARSR
jgi:heat shock protein HtpX